MNPFIPLSTGGKDQGSHWKLSCLLLGITLISPPAHCSPQAVIPFTLSTSVPSVPLSSCILPTGSSLGAFSGQELAQPTHLPKAQKCWGGNTLDDHLPPMKDGGRCPNTSATLLSRGGFWESFPGFSSHLKRMSPHCPLN